MRGYARAHETLTGFLLTTACTGVVFAVLVGRHVLLHPSRAAVGLNPASDFQLMTWSLKLERKLDVRKPIALPALGERLDGTVELLDVIGAPPPCPRSPP